MRLILVASLCLAAAACSRGDDNRIRDDAHAAGQDLAEAAQSVKHDPAVEQAGVDARQAAHDAAVSVRRGVADGEIKSGQALIQQGDKAKAEAHADSSGQ